MNIDTQLAKSGTGFTTKPDANRAHQYGTLLTIQTILVVGQKWNTLPPFSVGEISKKSGGLLPPHKSHRTGMDIDVRPLRRDGVNLPVTIYDSQYDPEATRKLIQCWRDNAMIDLILFNDQAIISAGLSQHSPGHANHFHVRLKPDAGLPVLKLTFPMVKKEIVLLLQRRLIAHGFTVSEDGLFGYGTQSAVKKFQTARGLTDDGICGSATWKELLKEND